MIFLWKKIDSMNTGQANESIWKAMNIKCISQYHEFPGNHYEHGTMPTKNNQERLTFNNSVA